ncbi:MAG: hypothetical protein WBC60_02640 [Cognaticolwellia sp.]
MRAQVTREAEQAVHASLGLKLKKTLTTESFGEQSTYLDSAAIASFTALNPIDKKHKYKSNINLQAINSDTFNFTGGSSSSGLGYSLALFISWWQDILKKNVVNNCPIFATGEVSNTGEVFEIGFIEEKLQSLCDYVEKNSVVSPFYVCYPLANDRDIQSSTKERIQNIGGRLISAKCIQTILEELIGDDYDGNPNSRWEPFKGLNSYTANDSVRFFGREKTKDKIVIHVNNAKKPLLYLASRGSGKTSLIDAALIPAFKKEEWEVLKITSFKTLLDVYFQIIQFVGSANDKISSLDRESLIYAESSLKIDDIRNITDIALKAYNSPTDNHLIIIDDFHLVFDTDNEANKELFVFLLNDICKLGIKVAAFSCREYTAYFEEKISTITPFQISVINDFSLKEIEEILIKQVEWAGYKFEEQRGVRLSHQIVNDIAQYDVSINVANFILKKLYDVASFEQTKVISFEHYDRLGKLPGIYTTLIIDNLQSKIIDEELMFQLFEKFYDESVRHSLEQENSFELETVLKLGLVKFNPSRGAFYAQKLLYETPFYQRWCSSGYKSWFEKIKAPFLEWKVLFEKEKAFDDSSLMSDEQNSKFKSSREKYSDFYKQEKKVDNELALGSTYSMNNNYLSLSDIIAGEKLIETNVISNEDLKLYVYLSQRHFLIKTTVRFVYLACAWWFFYAR